MVFAPLGDLFLSVSGVDGARFWRSGDGAAIRDLPLPASAGRVRCAAFSPDGDRLVMAGDRGLYLFVYPRHGLRRVELVAEGSRYRALAFGADGLSLAAGTAEGTIELFRFR